MIFLAHLTSWFSSINTNTININFITINNSSTIDTDHGGQPRMLTLSVLELRSKVTTQILDNVARPHRRIWEYHHNMGANPLLGLLHMEADPRRTMAILQVLVVELTLDTARIAEVNPLGFTVSEAAQWV